jgi:putrescine transport system substrate-binding protein
VSPHSARITDRIKQALALVEIKVLEPRIRLDTLAAFERLTGITVRVSYFDNLETLESRMLIGHSGFDVVVPTGIFIQRQIRSGAYLTLDKTKLPNLANLDGQAVDETA